jgi:voltage-gated potassium channel
MEDSLGVNVKKRIHQLLEPAESDVYSRAVDVFIIALILLNVLAVILETVDALAQNYGIVFTFFERFSIIVFTAEYVLRIATITASPTYRRPLWGRLRFMATPMAIIDLLAILPFYLPFLVGGQFVVLRLLRLFKLSRYFRALRIMGNVLREKSEELLISLVAVVFLLVLASCFMYFIEHEAQPSKFSSIPETMWWGVATLTTVGYGDVFPITPMGKFLGAIIAVLGIGLFALPAGILASGFSEHLEDQSEEEDERICQVCGAKLKDQ